MNLLLDTAAFLWLCAGVGQLSPAAAKALADPAGTPVVSAVTAWEIAIKSAKGKLKLPSPPASWFPAMISHHRLALLTIDAATAIASTSLPPIHGDPFDRLLVATAIEQRLCLVTPDRFIPRYPGLRTLW